MNGAMRYCFSRHLIIGVITMASANCHGGETKTEGIKVRKMAVAGRFYTASPSRLRAEIEGYLAAGAALEDPVRMLVSPHAGYVFSGPVAAHGFAAIDKSTSTVILLGPSHHVPFAGLSIPDVDAYETPLGNVPLDKKLIAKLRKDAAVLSIPGAHEHEHCLEVQLPFLQVVLGSFRIVPIITGRVNEEAVARLLLPHIGEKTLVIASSDLSHYKSHAQARKVDSISVATILSGKTDGPVDGCGEVPIRVLMHLAKMRELEPVVLDVRNSYETAPQHGSGDRVVGYAAIAYVTRGGRGNAGRQSAVEKTADGSSELPQPVKKYLLELARASLGAAVRGKALPKGDDAPARAREPAGCFVTLTKHGQLRGCIGYIEPTEILYKAVIENARNAALGDPRFSPVTPDDLDDITVEVSVLTRPERLEYSDPGDLLAKLVPGRDGIILEKGSHKSTFLPQVWDQLPDKVMFLEHLAVKGGMPRDGWKTAEVKRYFAIHFKEE